MVALLAAGGSAVWSSLGGLPGPVTAVLGLATVALVLAVFALTAAIWRRLGPIGRCRAAPKDAPSILVSYAKRNAAEKLIFTNDKPRVGVNVHVGPLVSAGERYEIVSTPDVVSLVSAERLEECQIFVERSRSILRLVDVLREGTPETVDTVVLDYEDSDGAPFCREFSLTLCWFSVKWKAGALR